MANEEHLKILKQGVKAWNKWRREHPDTKPDLTMANLSEANLSEANLDEANLSSAILIGADLRAADLGGADLVLAHMMNANLSRANLNWATLFMADLRGARLSRADLFMADLSLAILSEARLSRADLSGANLTGADLSEADLTGANLAVANFTQANLSGASVKNAIVASTTLGGVDLRVVKELETVRHRGPSTIGIDTVYQSKGKIPKVFLKGCGVPDTMIAHMGSLVGKASKYYSCFISYSSKNRDFAERLHNDLQAKSVQCWFAPEDIKMGEKFRTRIDEAIRLQDRLLLVLSKNSIQSSWVEAEVEATFERENRQKRIVLLPVRLDDAIMRTRKAWAAVIRRTRHIGDFSCWKDHDAYQKAFARLLRDLKAENQEP